MKTVEEILDILQKKSPHSIPTIKVAEEYARQQAIAFIKWAIDSCKVIGDNYGEAYTPHEEDHLYDQFIKHQQSTDNKKQ